MDTKLKKQTGVFLNPSSIAVIGATDRVPSWGAIMMKSLQSRKYPGQIYPVNRSAEKIAGLKAYVDIHSIPDTVDLAIMAVPGESALKTVRDCGENIVG